MSKLNSSLLPQLVWTVWLVCHSHSTDVWERWVPPLWGEPDSTEMPPKARQPLPWWSLKCTFEGFNRLWKQMWWPKMICGAKCPPSQESGRVSSVTLWTRRSPAGSRVFHNSWVWITEASDRRCLQQALLGSLLQPCTGTECENCLSWVLVWPLLTRILCSLNGESQRILIENPPLLLS